MINKNFSDPKAQQIHDILTDVYDALNERKYNATAQLAGYILSDDETYITPHNRARNRIKEVDHDEILLHLLKYYFDEQH